MCQHNFCDTLSTYSDFQLHYKCNRKSEYADNAKSWANVTDMIFKIRLNVQFILNIAYPSPSCNKIVFKLGW